MLQNPPTQTNDEFKHDFWFLFILLVDFMYICKQADIKQVISSKP